MFNGREGERLKLCTLNGTVTAAFIHSTVGSSEANFKESCHHGIQVSFSHRLPVELSPVRDVAPHNVPGLVNQEGVAEVERLLQHLEDSPALLRVREEGGLGEADGEVRFAR